MDSVCVIYQYIKGSIASKHHGTHGQGIGRRTTLISPVSAPLLTRISTSVTIPAPTLVNRSVLRRALRHRTRP